MNLVKWTLVTRRRDGALNVRRFVRQRNARRAYRSACDRTFMGENPIVEVWFFDSRESERNAQDEPRT